MYHPIFNFHSIGFIILCKCTIFGIYCTIFCYIYCILDYLWTTNDSPLIKYYNGVAIRILHRRPSALPAKPQIETRVQFVNYFYDGVVHFYFFLSILYKLTQRNLLLVYSLSIDGAILNRNKFVIHLYKNV